MGQCAWRGCKTRGNTSLAYMGSLWLPDSLVNTASIPPSVGINLVPQIGVRRALNSLSDTYPVMPILLEFTDDS